MNFNTGALLVTSLASLGLGIFVVSQAKRLPNFALFIFSMVLAGWCFGQFMGEVVPTKEMVLFWTRANLAFAALLPFSYLFFVLAFVNRLRENKKPLGMAFAMAVVFLLLDLTPLLVADVAPRLGYRFYPVPGIVYPIFALYIIVFFGLGLFYLWLFLKNSQGSPKNQAKYVFWASLIGFLGGATAFFPVFNINLPVVSHFALPLYLLVAVYAIVKHQLLDIRIVFRQGLIYSILTIFFAAFYVLIILLADRFLKELTRFDESVAVLLVTFVSVALFQPLRDQIQRIIDRIFFKGEFFYQKTISDLSEENRKLYHSLLQADKLASLGTIASGMAHEIKNPLASIKGMTQVLPENLGDQEFISKYTEIVSRQIGRINRLLEDMLDFGKPKELVMEETSAGKILEDVLRLLEDQCRKAGVEVEKRFRFDQKILADRERLFQVFMNIILNAIQAMPRGGKLLLECFRAGEELKIVISDSGIGIPADKIHRIFDPFYTTKEKGTGMGLAVAYRIVREHGGRIEVESEPGAGTTFEICLPIKFKESA